MTDLVNSNHPLIIKRAALQAECALRVSAADVIQKSLIDAHAGCAKAMIELAVCESELQQLFATETTSGSAQYNQPYVLPPQHYTSPWTSGNKLPIYYPPGARAMNQYTTNPVSDNNQPTANTLKQNDNLPTQNRGRKVK